MLPHSSSLSQQLLPLDIFQEILYHLSLGDSISLLQSCSQFYSFRSFWLLSLERARSCHPLPLPYGQSFSSLDDVGLRRIAYKASALLSNLARSVPQVKSISKFTMDSVPADDSPWPCLYLPGTNLILYHLRKKQTFECWDVSTKICTGTIHIGLDCAIHKITMPFVHGQSYTGVAVCKTSSASGSTVVRLLVFRITLDDSSAATTFTECFRRDLPSPDILPILANLKAYMCSQQVGILVWLKEGQVNIGQLDTVNEFSFSVSLKLEDPQLKVNMITALLDSLASVPYFHSNGHECFLRIADATLPHAWCFNFAVPDASPSGRLSSEKISCTAIALQPEGFCFQKETSPTLCGVHGTLKFISNDRKSFRLGFWNSFHQFQTCEEDFQGRAGIAQTSVSGLYFLHYDDDDLDENIDSGRLRVIRAQDMAKQPPTLTTHHLFLPGEGNHHGLLSFRGPFYLDDHLGVLRIVPRENNSMLVSIAYV